MQLYVMEPVIYSHLATKIVCFKNLNIKTQ